MDLESYWIVPKVQQVHRDWSFLFKVICHHNVHGIEIQIASTSGDKTKVWVVLSRSSNRYVDEFRHRESEKSSWRSCSRMCARSRQRALPRWRVRWPHSYSSKNLGGLACQCIQLRIQVGNPSFEICEYIGTTWAFARKGDRWSN